MNGAFRPKRDSATNATNLKKVGGGGGGGGNEEMQ